VITKIVLAEFPPLSTLPQKTIRNPTSLITQKYYGIGKKKWGEKRGNKQATQQHVFR
jgi:hypothetical protein